MKTKIIAAVLIVIQAAAAFCRGNYNLVPVNTQEIDLDGTSGIQISYSSGKVSLFMGTSGKLVIKEYMNEDNARYYARIANRGGALSVESGNRPFRPVFNFFVRRLEVYLPQSYGNELAVRSRSGAIESQDVLTASVINLETSSGSIRITGVKARTASFKTSSGSISLGSINGDVFAESSSGGISGEKARGNVKAKASSGGIRFGGVEGNVEAETSSGSIELDAVNGSVNAKASSGNIRCSITGSSGGVSLATGSGNVRLNVPRSLEFNFTSRTGSGSLNTPFQDKLFSPVTDKRTAQGVVGGSGAQEAVPSVTISTGSGSIRVNWTDGGF